MKEFLTNLDRINIQPNTITYIEHRSECIPYYGDKLPIFTAPMACVVNDENYSEFIKNKITPIIPRTVSYERRLELCNQSIWVAMGLDEFENFIRNTNTLEHETCICVDIANGHMMKLLGLCKAAKQKFGDLLVLMTGNIANARAYKEYAKIGIDYVRIGIGTGGACATNDLTGIGPGGTNFLWDLKYEQEKVSESFEGSMKYKSVPNIVYDGGCMSIRDIIIALAMGCNYVMCGRIFAQAKEACGEIILKEVVEPEEYQEVVNGFKIIKTRTQLKCIEGRMYYGMSTERAQREMGNVEIKHSEGKECWVPIKYTLKDWTDQFVAAIRSTMSYCDARTLYDFIGKPGCYGS